MTPKRHSAAKRKSQRSASRGKRLVNSFQEAAYGHEELFEPPAHGGHVSGSEAPPRASRAAASAESLDVFGPGVRLHGNRGVQTDIPRFDAAAQTDPVNLLDDAVERQIGEEARLYRRIAGLGEVVRRYQRCAQEDRRAIQGLELQCSQLGRQLQQQNAESRRISEAVEQKEKAVTEFQEENSQLMAQVSRLNAIVYYNDIYTKITASEPESSSDEGI